MNTHLSGTDNSDLIELSNIVYRNPQIGNEIQTFDGSDYEVIEASYDEDESGLDYMIVRNKNTEEDIIVFQGSSSEGKDLEQDWMNTNAVLGGNDIPKQYEAANQVYQNCAQSDEYNIKYVTGNSLGGGLATYVGTQNNVVAVAYNASPQPRGVKMKYNNNIIQYFSKDDPLTSTMFSLGMTDRYPGIHAELNNSIDDLSFLHSNHSGGFTIDANGNFNEYDLGNGHTISSMSEFISINPWTGRPLASGLGSIIKMNPTEIKNLATYMNNQMQELSGDAEQSLNSAKSLIDSAEQNFTLIQTDLKESIQPILIGPFEEIKSLFEQITQDIINCKVSTLASYGVVFLNPLCSAVIYLRDTCINLITSVTNLITSIKNYIEDNINNLTIGVTGNYSNVTNGLVAELKTYYENIELVSNDIKTQISNYAFNVKTIAEKMVEVDNLVIGSPEQINKEVSLKDCGQTVVDTDLMPNKLIEKNNILEQNTETFMSGFISCIEPNINEIESNISILNSAFVTANTILSSIMFGENLVETLTKYVINIDISESAIISELKNINDMVKQAELYIDSFVTVFKNLADNLSEFGNEIKPYIENAILEQTTYDNINEYNKIAQAYYTTINETFTEVIRQLSENESDAIKMIIQTSNKIKSNLDILDLVLSRGQI